MNPKLRIGILTAVAGLCLLAIGFFVFVRTAGQFLSPLPQPTAPPPLKEDVVVMTHDVALGTLLAASDLQIMQVPVELAPRAVLSTIESATGKITKVPLVSGQMVMSSNLADPTNINHDIAFTIDDSMVIMAFPSTDLMSTLNVLQRGDVVDIFVSVQQVINPLQTGPNQQASQSNSTDQQQETRLFTFDAMQTTQITAMVVGAAQQQGETTAAGSTASNAQTGPVKAYLLALKPQDALVLKHLKDLGSTFDIVLRSPASARTFDLTPVISEYIIDRYQLMVSP